MDREQTDFVSKFRKPSASVILTAMKIRRSFSFRHALAACLLCLAISAVSASDQIEIEISGERVTVITEQADLKLVLQELAAKGGFKVWMPPQLELDPISLRIEDEPLPAALRRLLTGTNHALVFRDDESIGAVFVLPVGEESTASLPAPGDASRQLIVDSTRSGELNEALQQMLDRVSNLGAGVPVQAPADGTPPEINPDAMNKILDALQDLRSRLPAAGQPADGAAGQ